MARFNVNTADNYGGNGNGSFFMLKDDKDTARVRFLYNTIEDVEGLAVHEVEIDGKKRYVNCIREYNEPIDNCPFCAAHMKVIPKLFIKLYNEDAKECQIWERGKSYFQKLASLASRYNPLVDEVIEIERCGKKNDMHTTYEFYPVDKIPVNMDDYDIPEALGTLVLDKSANEMEEYLHTGSFPSDGVKTAQASTNNNYRENYSDRPVGRRTPSSSNTRPF